ncbi:hypothetical protein BLX24_03890 [Arsenicibacter rosenii]|uniref:AAA+ ATPase domain-containing protein n=2 Tax=Arsenicibacter rosenii TaxID=1750698 RepID=A0A1S2VR16_9BACT|nr:ATP-binding protein [Arsenicibacter rosenii]OIN61212.1 hypothetical protein BLX24_03890 [Arsenicibacter rosenii]
MIDATAPKPSLWQRIKKSLFRLREYRIKIPATITPELVGRDEDVKKIERLLQQGVSVIVTGPTGIGKSFLIDKLRYPKKVLEIDDHKEFKRSLAACLVHLLGSEEEPGRQAVANLIYGTDNPDALVVKTSKESMPNLCRLLCDACGRKEYILKINDLESVTPSVVRILEMLKDHFVILTTARTVKMNNSSFLWDFEKIDLKPLSRPDSLRLFHRLTADLELQQVEWIQNKIHDTASGNPRMVMELAERIRQEPVIDAFVVDEICNNYLGRQTREIDISPVLLLLFGSLMILRYVGRETGDQELTFIGGAVLVMMMFARYFLKEGRRKGM